MQTEAVCREPTNFYLLGVALRSFFLVLATHLLAGEVDTTLASAPLTRRLSWWCRYYNPLNLSWRYYSMFAYRFTAHSWGTDQLALVNHEEHPFLPPLPYIVGEKMSPLHVRRLEMAGLLSSQGILTFSAAYQGALAIQYAISTEGIPYLPNMTVPLAMVGLFRVMASRWVASKIQVDAYPYPCLPSSPSSQGLCALCLWPFVRMRRPNTDLPPTSSCKDPYLPVIKSSKTLSLSPSSIIKSLRLLSLTSSVPSSTSSPMAALMTELSSPISAQFKQSCAFPPIHLPFSQPPSLLLPAYPYIACPLSPLHYSPSSSQSHISIVLPTLSRPYSALAPLSPSSAHERLHVTESLSSCTYSASPPQSCLLPSSFLSSDIRKASTHTVPSSSSSSSSSSSCTESSILAPCPAFTSYSCTHTAMPSSLPSVCQVHPQLSTYNQEVDYKSNKFVVAGWVGVLLGLVTMSFLPYKVAAAYQLPHRLLQFSMQLFYQYIAVSEFIFHVYLLFQGPRALANRVLCFDHWTFKAQTAGFYCLLIFMLVIALIDFVKHGFYRSCA